MFPEGSKTNGKGVLSIERDIIQMIISAAQNGIHVHTARFDYEFEFTSPYNTTDELGLKSTIRLITQV